VTGNLLGFLTVVSWVAVGLAAGALLCDRRNRRRVVARGRSARNPVCTSCPFVNAEQLHEILHGQPTEGPPSLLLPLPMLDGSGSHPAA
jgi:hypothetical protein